MPVVLRIILIFLLVALLAGGIAMLGNQLGRKIGRRKMTVFGMRPRHTSIFITTITGSLIAILTLIVAMAASQDVRTVITGSQERVKKYLAKERELVVRIQELAEKARVGAIIWKYEERVALNTIPARANEDEVKRILGALLKRANDLSVYRNNEEANRQRKDLLEIDTILVKYSPEEWRQWVLEFANLEEPAGVWVIARENCLFGDPVPVKLESFEAKLVFGKGETVYSTQIAPSEVLLDWHIFLRDFKAVALRKGMIEINDRLGGDIPGEVLKEISQAVVSNDAKIELKVIANRDLYRSSNLDVSIKVKPVVQ